MNNKILFIDDEKYIVGLMKKLCIKTISKI